MDHPIPSNGNGTEIESSLSSMHEIDKRAHEELDTFVSNSRSDAMEYLKMLREEITKTDSSRTRYTFLTWTLVGIFVLVDIGAASLKIDMFEKTDQILVSKFLPAAILCCFYLMMARMFVQRERLVISNELARRLFPSKSFPLSLYIKPSRFMLAERILNLIRPDKKILGNVLMLGVIIAVTVYGPILFSIYGYYSLVAKFGFSDTYVLISIAVGTVPFIQAMVSLRGSHVMSKQDREGNTAPRKISGRG